MINNKDKIMKRYIFIHPLYPNSHHNQKSMMINVDYIESIGECGSNGVITTPSQVIVTEEDAVKLIDLIKDVMTKR